MIDIKGLLELAQGAALKAGMAILKVYASGDFGIELKSDQSPLTLADKAAHTIISSCLEKAGLPMLSEEGSHLSYEERKNWDYYWLVDPLDGTKEFVKRNGEFTVNIALMHSGIPVAGVIYAPCIDILYY
ncbi:MAG: inositol monophosphatase family protein, partial [Ginsengibacter sp.]